MESNNIILGSIPGNCGGIHKTYEESIIIGLSHLNYRDLYKTFNYNINDPFRLYLYKKEGTFMALRKSLVNNAEDKEDYIEYEIINLYILQPEQSIVEVIDKRILHKHLLDERLNIDRISNKVEELNQEEYKTEELDKKSPTKFYTVKLNKNDYGLFNTTIALYSDTIPIIVFESDDKTHYIEYFTHKKVFKKELLAHPGLSYTEIRESTLYELNQISTYSKKLKDDPNYLDGYIELIDKIEQKSMDEYNEYIEVLKELESNKNRELRKK